MTNDKKKSDKQDQTVTPRSLADSVADDSLARETIGDETISAGDAIDETLSAGPQPDATAAPPPGVEAISLEEAGLRHEREPRKEGGESGAGRAAGVLLIVFLTLVAAGAGAALGPLIHRTPAQTVDLSGLESRLSDLEGKVADTTGLTDKIAALGQEADALKERIAALEATPVATTDGNVATLDVSELTQRIGALEHGVSALASRVDGAIDQKLQAIDGRIASLEGGTQCRATCTGMSAITATLHMFKPGDHIIASDDIYGGTYRLFAEVFTEMGFEFSFVKMRPRRDASRCQAEHKVHLDRDSQQPAHEPDRYRGDR